MQNELYEFQKTLSNIHIYTALMHTFTNTDYEFTDFTINYDRASGFY